jgi:hypothetical protein
MECVRVSSACMPRYAWQQATHQGIHGNSYFVAAEHSMMEMNGHGISTAFHPHMQLHLNQVNALRPPPPSAPLLHSRSLSGRSVAAHGRLCCRVDTLARSPLPCAAAHEPARDGE